MKLVARFVQDEAGVTAIEYAVLAGMMAFGIIIWAGAIGGALNSTLATIAGNFAG